MAFCSMTCQSSEASKSYGSSFSTFNSKLLNSNSTLHLRQPGKPPSLPSYQMSYHRRPSLSYSTTSSTMDRRKPSERRTSLSSSLSAHRAPPFFLMQSISTSSSFSSSLSDVSVFSTSCSCEDKVGNTCPPYHNTRTTHNIAS